MVTAKQIWDYLKTEYQGNEITLSFKKKIDSVAQYLLQGY